eukprot:SM000155S01641  [mRNA]  locus=s155:20255:22700:- [translate_table: standard]
MQQRRVDNSYYLWLRLKELNRRDVEEKSEDLRSLSWITGLLTAFTMTTVVEFTYSTRPPVSLLTIYAATSALVPCFMTLASMISVHLLASILKMGKWFVAEDSEEEFMARCRTFGLPSLAPPPAPRRTFDRFWTSRCEDDWRWVFRLFYSSVTTFFLQICTIAFIRFQPSIWIPVLFSAEMAATCLFWFVIVDSWGRYITVSTKHGAAAADEVVGGGGGGSPSSTTSASGGRTVSGGAFDWHIAPRVSTTEAILDSKDPSLAEPSRFQGAPTVAAMVSGSSSVRRLRRSLSLSLRRGDGPPPSSLPITLPPLPSFSPSSSSSSTPSAASDRDESGRASFHIDGEHARGQPTAAAALALELVVMLQSDHAV